MSSTLLQSSNNESLGDVRNGADDWQDNPHRSYDNSANDISTQLNRSNSAVRKSQSWRDNFDSSDISSNDVSKSQIHRSSSFVRKSESWRDNLWSTNDVSTNAVDRSSHRSDNLWSTNGTSTATVVDNNSTHRSSSIVRKSYSTSTNDFSTVDTSIPDRSFEDEWHTTLEEQAMILAKFEEESKKTKMSIKRSKSVTTAAAASSVLVDKKSVDRNEARQFPDNFGISNGETLVVDQVRTSFIAFCLTISCHKC